MNIFQTIVHLSHDELTIFWVTDFDNSLIVCKELLCFYCGVVDEWCANEFGCLPHGHVVLVEDKCEHAFVILNGATISEKLSQFITSHFLMKICYCCVGHQEIISPQMSTQSVGDDRDMERFSNTSLNHSGYHRKAADKCCGTYGLWKAPKCTPKKATGVNAKHKAEPPQSSLEFFPELVLAK
uniref:VGCC_alpha2 domain-containing protein n=1 Tax=Angiostrongylus cantonensis TaxID=6313 RepID=A0A0K0CZR9_ANGCA